MNSCFEPLRIDTPLTTRPFTLDHPLANLCGLFDRYHLLAVPRGVQPDAAPGPILTEVITDDYLRRLATSSIAVSLGGHPGLIAIKFKDRSGLDDFLARNPTCAETLITAHTGGPIVWLRAPTTHRTSLELPGVQVKMGGHILVYDRTALHCQDEFVNLAEIKVMDLFALDWGQDSDGRVAAWLVALAHGEFVHRTQRGRIKPKRAAWRDYLVRRLKPTIAFDRATGGFWRRLNGDVWQPLNEQQTTNEVRQLVISAPVPGAQAHSWCNDEWLIGMLRYLRRVLVGEVPFAINHLRAFARGALISAPGQDVTVPELCAAFSRYCRERELPVLPKGAFQKMIVRVMKEPPWHKTKSKSVTRPTGSQNGFRGIALRASWAVRVS